MKKITVSMFVLSALVLTSCGGEEKAKEEVAVENQEKIEEVAKISGVYALSQGTTVTWNARHYKDTAYVHQGTVLIAEGSVVVDNNNVVGGDFSFDMNSILEPDTDTTQDWTLQGHFKMADFFNVAEFAASSFSISNVEGGVVTGDMSFIGVTKEISFPAEIAIEEEKVSVKADFELDLLQFNIPILVEGDTLPEVEKMESAYPLARIQLELLAEKAAQ